MSDYPEPTWWNGDDTRDIGRGGPPFDFEQAFWKCYRSAAYWNEVPAFLDAHRNIACCKELVAEAERRWKETRES